MSATPPGDRLLASVDGAAYPLSEEECVFRTRGEGEKHVMTLEVLQAMDACSRFRTFDEHVAHVARSQGKLQGQDVAVRQVLDSAVRRGLFVTADEALSAGDPGGEPEGPVPVFIRAGGRPGRLATLLGSAREMEARHGRRHRYFAVDDADGSESREILRGEVREAADAGLDCRLLDRDWQAAFLARVLDEAGLADDTAARKFLLGDDTGAGRVRNLVQLAAAGVPHLLLEDGQTCRARAPGDGPGGLSLDSDRWAIWFHADADAAAGWGEDPGLDPLAEHYRALGLSGAQGLRRFGRGPAALGGLDNRELQRMGRGGILATQNGLYGEDDGAGHIWYYLARGESLERWHPGEAEYRRFRASTFRARVREDHAFQTVGSFAPVGLSGDRPLPPMPPAGPRGDLFFTAALHALHPHARVLEFPWALGHFPGAGEWPELAWETAFTGGLSRFLAAELAALTYQLPEMNGDARFRLVAERLAALAALGDDDLLDRIASFHVAQRARWMDALQAVRREARGGYPAWLQDVKTIIGVNGQSLERGVPRRLPEMPGDPDDAAAAAWLRGRVEPLARAMREWPALWRTAAGMGAIPELAEVAPVPAGETR